MLSRRRNGNSLLWATSGMVLLLWILATLTSHTWGGFVHLMFLITMGWIVMKAIQGRKKPVWFFLLPRQRTSYSKSYLLNSKIRW